MLKKNGSDSDDPFDFDGSDDGSGSRASDGDQASSERTGKFVPYVDVAYDDGPHGNETEKF